MEERTALVRYDSGLEVWKAERTFHPVQILFDRLSACISRQIIPLISEARVSFEETLSFLVLRFLTHPKQIINTVKNHE